MRRHTLRTTILAFVGIGCLAMATSVTRGELIVNGNFEAGNFGFTSNYTYIAPPGGNSDEGEYTVRSDPQNFNGAFHNFGDHTTGSSLMMVINGDDTGTKPNVWVQSVSVLPNTNYDFSLWVGTAVSGGPAVLDVLINNVTIGTKTAPAEPGTWENFLQAWNSGASTAATIRIVNTNPSTFPNDFYLDDISFRQAGSVAAVPEPATFTIWSLSAIALSLVHARCRRLAIA